MIQNTETRGISSCLPLNKCSIAEMGDRLATIDMGQKFGAVPLLGGELGPHLIQCGQGRGLPACQVSSRSLQPFGHKTATLQTGQTDRQRSDSIGRTVFSERELTFTFAICYRPSVCLSSVVCCLSVTRVHPTQAVQIFGNISTAFGTLAIR